MALMRTIEEAEEVINRLGRPPEDESILLWDGRLLRTPDEVRAWLESIQAEQDAATDAGISL